MRNGDAGHKTTHRRLSVGNSGMGEKKRNTNIGVKDELNELAKVLAN